MEWRYRTGQMNQEKFIRATALQMRFQVPDVMPVR